jgi:hypothetical protein
VRAKGRDRRDRSRGKGNIVRQTFKGIGEVRLYDEKMV